MPPIPAAPITEGLEDRASGSRLGLAAGAVCVVLVGLDLRPGIVSVGPLLVAVRERFGLSHAAAAMLVAIPDVLMALLSIAAPALARRFGRDRVILAALAVLGIATAARATAASAALLFAWTAGVGAGIAVAGALIGGFVKALFPDRAPLVLGLYTAALSLGSTLAAGLTGPAAALGRGWRPAAGLWAGLALPALAAWLFVHARLGGRAQSAPRRHRLPVRNAAAWLIALFFAAQNFLFYALVSWLTPLYREARVSAGTAGLILASFTLSFFCANLVAGLASRKPDRRPFLAGFAGLALAGLVGLALAPLAAPFVLVPAIAFGLGGCFTLGMTLPLDHARDPEEANAWGALVTLVAYLVAATGPLAVGALRDVAGSFAPALWLLAGAGSLLFGLTPFLRPRLQGAP